MPELINLHTDNLSHADWQQAGEHTLPVLTVKQIRTLESKAFEQVDSFLLMQAAGIRSALKIKDQLTHSEPHSTRCLVFAGPGNNGGDACIVAGELKRQGLQVELYQITGGKTGSKDRMEAVLWALASGVQAQELEENQNLPDIEPGFLVIDGLLGIACDSAPRGLLGSVINHVNTQVDQINSHTQHKQVRVYSLDCPSGLNCNSGLTEGTAISAHVTFSYLACKHGLLTNHGKALAGELWIDSLGCEQLLDKLLADKALGANAQTVNRQGQLFRLPKREHQHHKGNFGSIAVLGGEQGMVGACLLSARTALMLGCGRVATSLLCETDMHLPDVQRQGQMPFLDPLFPEIMNKGLESNLEFADTVIVGPGLGRSDEAIQMIHTLLEHDRGLNMVWDADALNLLSVNSTLRSRYLHYRTKHPAKYMVFTPHPLEAARLLQSTTDMIQGDRPTAARSISKQFNCTVLLKGSGSLICHGEQLEINTTGGPALGTAGSGDVLAGAIAALLGQGLNAFDAAALATHIHGLAVEPGLCGGDHLERDYLMISHASEIAQRMKRCLNHLLNQRARRNGQLP